MNKETKTEEPAEVEVGETKHPLLEFAPTTFHLFEEWLERWKGTTYLAEKLGLLHCLTTENGWWQSRELVLLLLEIADGYTREYGFAIERERDGDKQNARNRKDIAEKSFGVLCLKFFKGKTRDRSPSWWWMLEDEVLFQKVLWFLRRDDHRMQNRDFDIAGDSISHLEGIFRIFMYDFAQLGWNFRSLSERGRSQKADELARKRLIAARPQFIEILDELRALNWLNGQELDAASLKKLTELALGKKYHFPPTRVLEGNTYRKPENLAEAVLGGSVAAQVVLLHQVRQKELGRIKKLFEASRAQHEETQRQRELAQIAEEEMALAERAKELKG